MRLIKKNIRLFAALLSALLVSLIVFGAYSVLTLGNRWFSSSANTYARGVRSTVIAGRIIDRNGAILAETVPEGKRVYHPDRLVRTSVVHVVGDGANKVANSAENFLSSYLYAFNETWLEKLSRVTRGEKRQGNDITLTINAALSKKVSELFPRGKSGAVVVMNYLTGEVLSLQSFPVFDPENISPSDEAHPQKPFWNRSTQWVSAPGSTFKVVTLASALENITGLSEKRYDCSGRLSVAGSDADVTDAGNAIHGSISPKEALALSCNVAFAQIALELGDDRLRNTARSFGVGDYFLFRDIVVENSSYPTGNRSEKEVAWTGVGQSALGVTPLHMCMVAASIANDGIMMEPRLLLQAVSVTGEKKAVYTSKVYRRALPQDQARLIGDYMRNAVTSGTASAASVPGLAVCGKTGSAQVDGQSETNAWFIGFCDDPRLPVAICVAVEDAGSGGSVAAPVAGSILRYLASGNN